MAEKNGAEITGTVFALMNPEGDIVWSQNHEWTLPKDWEEFTSSKVLALSDRMGMHHSLELYIEYLVSHNKATWPNSLSL